jgi:hypothetical protein
LRVSKGTDYRLAIQTADDSEPVGDTRATAPDATAAWPHSLSLLRHMLLRTPEWRHPGRSGNWQWQHVS